MYVCTVRSPRAMCMVCARPRGLQRGGTRWSGEKTDLSPDHRVPPRCRPRGRVQTMHIARGDLTIQTYIHLFSCADVSIRLHTCTVPRFGRTILWSYLGSILISIEPNNERERTSVNAI